ncbi:MAG: molybdenum cofactor biosynthesis protein MoaE [Nitrososphaerales archaeon]|jgi:molybdopterin synthase catalytic subunit
MNAASGGRVTRERLDPSAVLAQTSDPSAGGTVLFVGTVRDDGEAGKVDRILYEAYEALAERRLLEIEEGVKSSVPGARVALRHRVGELRVGEVSVAVAVSAPHRAEAFEACRLAIERIKHEVPIWKKERLADGSERWVEGTALPAADPKTKKGRGKRGGGGGARVRPLPAVEAGSVGR